MKLPPLRLAPLALALLAALPASLPAQNNDPAAAQKLEARAAEIRRQNTLRNASDASYGAQSADDAPPKFDLDFPGGTPAELVNAINKASGQTLNAIIAPEYATKQLPPIKVKGVNAAQLFGTLANVQRGPVTRMNGFEYNNRTSFITDDGSPSARSIWYFAVGAEVPSVPKTSRFFSLASYLQQGVTVDDITTAIRTGWEMRGETQPPALKFHQETQLLIAVGQPDQLAVIGDVLEALEHTLLIRAQTAATAKDAAH